MGRAGNEASNELCTLCMMYNWSGNEATVCHKVVSYPSVHTCPPAENAWWFNLNSCHGAQTKWPSAHSCAQMENTNTQKKHKKKYTKNNQQLTHITHSCTHCTPDAIMQAHFYTPAQSSSTQLTSKVDCHKENLRQVTHILGWAWVSPTLVCSIVIMSSRAFLNAVI